MFAVDVLRFWCILIWINRFCFRYQNGWRPKHFFFSKYINLYFSSRPVSRIAIFFTSPLSHGRYYWEVNINSTCNIIFFCYYMHIYTHCIIYYYTLLRWIGNAYKTLTICWMRTREKKNCKNRMRTFYVIILCINYWIDGTALVLKGIVYFFFFCCIYYIAGTAVRKSWN